MIQKRCLKVQIINQKKIFKNIILYKSCKNLEITTIAYILENNY